MYSVVPPETVADPGGFHGTPISEADHVRTCKIFPPKCRKWHFRNSRFQRPQISCLVIVPGGLARNPRFQNPGSATERLCYCSDPPQNILQQRGPRVVLRKRKERLVENVAPKLRGSSFPRAVITASRAVPVFLYLVGQNNNFIILHHSLSSF